MQAPNPEFDSYPAETVFWFWKFQAEDGSQFSYFVPWWNDETMAMIPDEHRDELDSIRIQALWLGMESLFNGKLPGYPKAVRIIAQHKGTRDSIPPWWGVLT